MARWKRALGPGRGSRAVFHPTGNFASLGGAFNDGNRGHSTLKLLLGKNSSRKNRVVVTHGASWPGDVSGMPSSSWPALLKIISARQNNEPSPCSGGPRSPLTGATPRRHGWGRGSCIFPSPAWRCCPCPGTRCNAGRTRSLFAALHECSVTSPPSHSTSTGVRLPTRGHPPTRQGKLHCGLEKSPCKGWVDAMAAARALTLHYYDELGRPESVA